MSNERSISIFFTDGSNLALTFPKQDANPHLLARRVQTALDSRQLAFEIENELLVIPTNNIKYLQMSPCPEMLPETVIVGGAIKSPDEA
ncbi:MAG: hypothetical protein LJE92_03785 [Gammaproteobacteria bacterium]|jgi:hypothetical protein|nr:hypothetical protein [Gammaproteobacteria bacterium]